MTRTGRLVLGLAILAAAASWAAALLAAGIALFVAVAPGGAGDTARAGREVTPAAGDATAGAGAGDATGVPPDATPTASAVDWPDLVDLDGRTPVTNTVHFAVHAADASDDGLVALARRWAPELEGLLADEVARLGRELARAPVAVVFNRTYGTRCPARGLAVTLDEAPRLEVFVDERTSDVQIRAVLAHEIAHHLTVTEDFTGDAVLTEGVANWLADGPMLRWQGFASWDDAVREYIADGTYLSVADPLAQLPVPGEDCLARRDRVYNVRAAFVGWLIDRFGLETVLAMPYRELPGPTPEDGGEATTVRVPDYEAATGMDLVGLERAWLRDLGYAGEVGRPTAGARWTAPSPTAPRGGEGR